MTRISPAHAAPPDSPDRRPPVPCHLRRQLPARYATVTQAELALRTTRAGGEPPGRALRGRLPRLPIPPQPAAQGRNTRGEMPPAGTETRAKRTGPK